jgi:cellulose biosynthesis protein BcsQ
MLIGFWSTHHGQAGTTTNLLSIALSTALKFKLKVLIGHIQPGITQMERALFPEEKLFSNSYQTNENTGNALIRLARNGMLHASTISNYTVPLLKDLRLDVLNGKSLKLEREDLEDTEILKRILSTADEAYDVIFLDLHSGLEKEYTKSLLSFMDYIVVNTSQNHEVIESYLNQSVSLNLKSEPLFCVGRYQQFARLNQKMISKKLKSKCMVNIPHHTALMDLMNEGNIVEYFGRHFYKSRFEKHTPFIDDVSKSAYALLKHIELLK